jgi:putative ABC transport system permease protein
VYSVFAQYAIKEMKRRKLRSIANVSGYIIAVASLIVLVTLAQGYNAVAAVNLRGIGTHFATYIPSSKVCPCEYAEVGPFFRDTYTPTFNLSVVQTIKKLPGVLDAAPCLSFKLDNLTISGVDFDALATQTTIVSQDELITGAFPSSNDWSGVVLDAPFSRVSKLDIGDTFVAFERNFTVIGIVDPSLHSKPAGLANIYATLGVVQGISRHYGDIYNFAVSDINLVVVEISPNGDEEFIITVERSALNVLESYAGQSGAIVGYQCGFAARKVVSITEDGAWITSIVLFVSATFFSIRSQFGSVVERTKEIGVLKAIGWADSDITGQVFFESLFQGLVGGIVGVGVGYLVTFIIPQLGVISTQNLVLAVEPLIVIFGLAISLTGGLLAGIVPAWRAARLQPVEALRHF